MLYYAITFLNQIVLTNSDVETSNHLIELYFTLFESMVRNQEDEPCRMKGIIHVESYSIWLVYQEPIIIV